MFGSRRLAKRSIVGTRVAALWQDGRYYPGVIQAQTSDAGSPADSIYTVRFDDGFLKEVHSSDIVGPGFQTVTTSKLKKGQKVYITLNGRETTGILSGLAFEDAIINVKTGTGELVEITRRADDVRLMKSRKSARLQDLNTDYSLMADLQITEPKRRTVSHVIDVPAKATDRTSGRGRQDAMDETSDFVPELCTFDAEGAAKVLNSLNVSSQPSSSPGWQTRDLHGVLPGDGGLSSSAASSGFGSGQSEGGPSPPHNPLLSTPMDDGLDLEENVNAFYNDSSPRQEEEPSQSTMYKCLWKLKAGECGLFFGTEDEVISHIRKCHFNGQEMPDGEEDFYFTDVEMEGVTSSFARMTTASSPPSGSVDFPPGASSLPSAFDHDYQLKQPAVLVASSVPTGSNFLWPGSSRPIPINLPEGQITRSLSWQPSTSPSPQQHPLGVSPLRTSQSSVQERLQQHQALSPKSHMLSSPPKGASSSRKPRSETTAKCRKHFGTDKREMWCTQCKWKKACSRFT